MDAAVGPPPTLIRRGFRQLLPTTAPVTEVNSVRLTSERLRLSVYIRWISKRRTSVSYQIGGSTLLETSSGDC